MTPNDEYEPPIKVHNAYITNTFFFFNFVIIIIIMFRNK